MPDLHPDIEPIGFLVGTWRGAGSGSYPTIEGFSYNEEITFGHVGKPFLAYGQKTKHAETGLPMHAESGYWRLHDGRNAELVLAHPTGIVEVLAGSWADGVFDLRSVSVVGTPTAKSVTETHRRFEIVGDELRYDVAMAAVGEPLTHHLSAVLQRSVDD